MMQRDRVPRATPRLLMAGSCLYVAALGCSFDDRQVSVVGLREFEGSVGQGPGVDCEPGALGCDGGALPVEPICPPGLGACGECSAGDERSCVGALGDCAGGKQRCGDDATWGPCSIQPAAVDTCTPGADADCDGIPNNPPEGCRCSADVACGVSDVGNCALGVSTCTAGQTGPCVGAIGPAPRDCRSSADNDCDGRADNTVDAVCLCVPDAVEACLAHPGLDGAGICSAGQRTCVASANALSSAWGACLGSVAPAVRNCASELDNDCNGVADRLDASCTCVVGTTRACGPATCGGVQTCELSFDRSSTQFGACVPSAVAFPDAALSAAVRQAVGSSAGPGQPIEGRLIAGLTALTARQLGITRLNGLECATSLTALELYDNQIADLAPLVSLPALTSLSVGRNLLSAEDLTVLAGMTSLESLGVEGHSLTDASALRSLTRLKRLSIALNQLTDVSWLANLRSLEYLEMVYNEIVDVSWLASLPALQDLVVNDNPIEDMSPVTANRSLRRLQMGRNNLRDLSFVAELPPLDYIWVEGLTDFGLLRNQTELTQLGLSNATVTDLSSIPIVHPRLNYFWLVDSNAANLSPLLNLTGLTSLTLTGTPIDCSSAALAQLAARVSMLSTDCTNL